MKNSRLLSITMLSLLAACPASNGPEGPNLIVANEHSGGTVFVALVDTLGDTVFSATLAEGAIECRTLDVHGLVTGNVIATDTVITVRPMWPSGTQGWSDKFLIRPGTALIQTHGVRDGCEV